MKISFDIDCSPDEARQFFGLPHIAPLQDAMMKELEKKMSDHIRDLDPEKFINAWMPATMQGWQEMQKMFMSQMGNMGGSMDDMAANLAKGFGLGDTKDNTKDNKGKK